MKYLLVVGFACEVYKKEPRARIFVNDKLIDEFHISHHPNTLLFTFKDHILKPFTNINFLNTKIKNFPPLRFYEIEIDQTQEKLRLHIDIENDDSNYTNGFITASTLLQLQIFYFFPLNKELLSTLSKILIKNRENKNWTYCRNSNIFNLERNSVKWYGKNGQIIESTNNNNLCFFNIGGNGHFVCNLVKKYGIFIPKLTKSYRYYFFIPLINYFCNKYEQYANQRNTD